MQLFFESVLMKEDTFPVRDIRASTKNRDPLLHQSVTKIASQISLKQWEFVFLSLREDISANILA